MALRLLAVSGRLDVSFSALARASAMNKRAVSRLLTLGVWPKCMSEEQRQEARKSMFAVVRPALLQARDVDHADMGLDPLAYFAGLFDEVAQPPALRPGSIGAGVVQGVRPSDLEKEDLEMIFGKQPLSQEARTAFGLFSNPFDGEVTCADEMFQNAEFRYCREACWQAANHGRFVAVVGESGAGKTTLFGDLAERITTEHRQVVLIAPSVLGMEDNDKAGKTLKATGIMDSIIYTLDRLAVPRRTMEAKTRQLQQMLEESAKAGNKHLLVIEEAHSLPIPTLKHLKRLHELRMGRAPLMGILLLGQPELRDKLNENRHDVREVVQRCELVQLQPLEADLKSYLTTRCKRANKQLAELFDDSGIEAMRTRLTVQTDARRAPGAPARKGFVSLVYPLACNNFATAALNRAAELGVPVVTRDVVDVV